MKSLNCSTHVLVYHRHSQDFLCGCALSQMSDDLFLVLTFSYAVIYLIYCHQLPFSHLRGAHHQIQSHFALFKQKCLENFSVALGGYTCARWSP